MARPYGHKWRTKLRPETLVREREHQRKIDERDAKRPLLALLKEAS